MKLFALCTFMTIALLPGALHGQSRAEPPTRVLDRFGGFVGLGTRFGDMRGEFGILVGGDVALVLDRSTYIGVAGFGLANSQPGVEFGYGGALVGTEVPLFVRTGLQLETIIAGGAVKASGDWDELFVFEPSAAATIRFARVARLAFGVGYRFVGGVDDATLSDEDLRGVTGTVSLRAGWF